MFLASPSASPRVIFTTTALIPLLTLIFTGILPISYVPIYCLVLQLIFFALLVTVSLSIKYGWYSVSWYRGWAGQECNV